MRSRAIKVLVVEDSLLFREVICRGISSDTAIHVVATASDPYEASEEIARHRPDVMLCDVQMPRMNGIAFIRQLLPQYQLPVIVVSSVSEAVLDALKAGAIDFVPKPDMGSAARVERFILELIRTIKGAAGSRAKVDALGPAAPSKGADFDPSQSSTDMIAIGASTGGTEAIAALLRSLPAGMPGIVIVQHIPPVFSKMFAQRLDQSLPMHVREAADGDRVATGDVLIAPGDHHMELVSSASGYKVRCFRGDKVNGHCPSVDVLFQSVAKEVGKRSAGIILTGMGYDGARGLLAMRRRGAVTLAQDEASSVVYGMPKAAFELGAAQQQVALSRMGQMLLSLL